MSFSIYSFWSSFSFLFFFSYALVLLKIPFHCDTTWVFHLSVTICMLRCSSWDLWATGLAFHFFFSETGINSPWYFCLFSSFCIISGHWPSCNSDSKGALATAFRLFFVVFLVIHIFSIFSWFIVINVTGFIKDASFFYIYNFVSLTLNMVLLLYTLRRVSTVHQFQGDRGWQQFGLFCVLCIGSVFLYKVLFILLYETCTIWLYSDC